MICFVDCATCKHQRETLIDGWIDSCDAFPNGKPLDFNYGLVKEMKECDNGIGYELNEEVWNADGTLKNRTGE